MDSIGPRLRFSLLEPLQSSQAPIGLANELTSSKTNKTTETRRRRLLTFEDMPEWFQLDSNKWIHYGYRPISGSIRDSLASWFYVHNESVNIYSHLIPAVVFVFGGWHSGQYLASRYSGVTVADVAVFSIFMFTAVTCMSLSATYHTLTNHSEHMEHLCLRLDMLGVVIFIIGDLILGTYLLFWCEPWSRNAYWILTGILGSATIFVTLHPKCKGAKYRLFRALMFVAIGLSGIAPLIHGFRTFGLSGMMTTKAFPYTVGKAACLLSGVAFYATRYPESRYPGRFDLCGSHAIFHVLVVCATIVQLTGYLKVFDHAQASLTC